MVELGDTILSINDCCTQKQQCFVKTILICIETLRISKRSKSRVKNLIYHISPFCEVKPWSDC